MELKTAQTLACHAQRRVAFDGTMNCRDLGGLPIDGGGTTTSGRIFRSGRLSNLTDDDLERFRDLRVKHIFDFRLPFERERYPNRIPDGCDAIQHQHGYLPDGALDMFEAINTIKVPVEDVWRGMRDQYQLMATAHPDIHSELYRRIIASDATPFLFHCSGGKDRTGVASAMLLRAAGVSREVVIADYLLTNLDTPKLGVLGPTVEPEVVAIVGAAHKELIEGAMDAVEREYSTYENYVRRGVGLTASEYRTLMDILIG